MGLSTALLVGREQQRYRSDMRSVAVEQPTVVQEHGAGTAADHHAFQRVLARLVRDAAAHPDRGTDDHDSDASLNRQVRAFLLYREHIETGRRILDWGCRQALESCMARMVNPTATIEGCDIDESMLPETQQFARMGYTRLTHPWRLPYGDAAFDRVIASGILEHAPVTTATLQELHRIIEDGGYLAITFLPNRLSYTEFCTQRIFKNGHHRRMYSISRLKRLLEDHGFETIEAGYHQLLPSMVVGHTTLRWPRMAALLRILFRFDPIVERIWPLKLFCSNIYAAAIRRGSM
jgi:ubiquinone/menaquinone biosynthesis C-methylase UbiE